MRTVPRYPLLLLVVAMFSSLTATHAQTYHARDEFTLTQGGSNNRWQYGYTASDGDNAFISFVQKDTVASCNGGSFERWYLPTGDATPQIARNTATVSCSNVPPELLFVHPGGAGQRVVLRWTAPAAGTHQVKGVLSTLR